MDNRSKMFFTFAIGVISGIALLKFLDSKKGEDFIENTKEKSLETINDLKNKIKEMEREVSELVVKLSDDHSQNKTSI